MVMPYYEGPTLKAALAQQAERPDEATIRTWLDPLLDALAVLHGAGCLHRDIAPDNILLTASGPLLLDFGAARRVIGDLTHDLTVVLKPGYAPIEQYGDVPTMTQGPWTDLYALACVVYYAITGKVPMPSVERAIEDHLPLLSTAAAGRYGESLLRVMDAALAVRPQDRPQDVARLRTLLGSPAPPSTQAAMRPGARLWPFAAMAAAVLVIFAVWLAGSGKDDRPQPPNPGPQPMVTVSVGSAVLVHRPVAITQPDSAAYATATAAASLALFSTSWMLPIRLSPPVSALTRASRNGVADLPVLPCACASANACSIARSTISRGSACCAGIGLATTSPPPKPRSHFDFMTRAISSGSSSRTSTPKALSRLKKPGRLSVR
jgi:hypothetical protein